jgi:hypothetical protein
LKKEYIVVRIDAAPDSGPYVLLSFTDPRDIRRSDQTPLNPNVMAFKSMDDLMKNLQKSFAGLSNQMSGGVTTTIKMDMREYEDSGLKVGDKVYIEVSKVLGEGV